MNPTFISIAAVGMLLAVGQASATTITFDEVVGGVPVVAVGDTLSTQYDGVTFSANAFTGAGSPTGNWASNTDMTIVSSTGADVGGLGSSSLVSGNVLHSFGGWLAEDGDPSFLITFAAAIKSISVDFAGVSTPADVHLIAYNGATQIGDVTSAVTTGQFTLSFAAPSITSVAVMPGSYNDWVGVDNITFAVPEISTYAMMAMGIGLLAFKRRKAA